MRSAYLIVTADLLAFALGVVLTLWLTKTAPPALPTNAPLVAAIHQGPAAPMPASASGSGAAEAATAPPSTAPAPNAPMSSAPMSSAPPPTLSTAAAAAEAPPPPASDSGSAPADAPADPAASAAGPSPTSAYVLQLAAFREPANATRMKAELMRDGFAASVVPFKSNGKAWQWVQVGSFVDRSSAAEAAASLRRHTGLAALVIKPEPQ